MNQALIRQAHQIYTRCGAVKVSSLGVAVPRYKAFLMPMVVQPGASTTFSKLITGGHLWELRAIASDQGMNSYAGVRVQVELEGGRFLFGGNGIDIGQLGWVGSYRYLMDPPEECRPGSKIIVSLADAAGTMVNPLYVNLLFEGVQLLPSSGSLPASYQNAVQIPRYQGILNENILAPCWAMSKGPATPPGYRDEKFTYSSTVATITIGAALTTTIKIPIDNISDFVCRRFLVDVKRTGTATGSILGRIRNGTGYAICDDFIDLARYIGGAALPKDWTVRAGDEIFIDLALVDTGGAGALTFQLHLEGARRRPLLGGVR